MEDSFVLQEEIQTLQQNLCDYAIDNEIEIGGLQDKDLARHLNEITERLEVSSRSVMELEVFEKIASFLKNFDQLSPRIASRLLEILLSGFRSEIKATADDIGLNDMDTFPEHRSILERYIFLVYWLLLQIEESSHKSESSSSGRSRQKGKKKEDDFVSSTWINQRRKIYDMFSWLLDLKLAKLWTLPQDRTILVNIFTKPCYKLFESSNMLKYVEMKNSIFQILGICIKRYDHQMAAQTTVMQTLQYWEHSAEPMADLLHFLVDKHDYAQLTDEILRQISNLEFKDVAAKELKDTANPKTFSAFLLHLTDLAPRSILKNLGLLIHLLDSESYTMRMGIIEILGRLIIELTQTAADDQSHRDQINGYFDILEERMLDPIAFCRVKVLQMYLRLLELPFKFPKRRQALAALAIRHLEDKSSGVRKYAVRTLNKLISTHPFDMYGGELKLSDWQDRLTKVTDEIKNSRVANENDNPLGAALISPAATSGEPQSETPVPVPEETSSPTSTSSAIDTPTTPTVEGASPQRTQDQEADDTITMQIDSEVSVSNAQDTQPAASAANGSNDDDDDDDDDDDVPTSHRQTSQPPTPVNVIDPEKLKQLGFMQTFLKDAVAFIEQLEKSMPLISQFLSSKSKMEVLEAMDFFMTAHLYKVNQANAGIRKMLHLIWTKDTSDEGKGIKMKLLGCYRSLYIDMDSKMSRRQNIAQIAKNLIELTYNATLADLTSLEQVLSILMKESAIIPEVIEKLWQVYGFARGQIPKHQRRGAIIILGMLAKADTDVVAEKIDVMLDIGLGHAGKVDLVLARHTCIALQRLAGTKSDQVRGVYEGQRFPMAHPMFHKLRTMIDIPSKSMEWFGMCEQALNAIYGLGDHPDLLCGDLIKARTKLVFTQPTHPQASDDHVSEEISSPPPTSADHEHEPMDVDQTPTNDDTDTSNTSQTTPVPTGQSKAPPLDQQDPFALSQLIFIVGHVAIKQTVYLELLEAVWKRKKAATDKAKIENAEVGDDELEQVGGSAEDDIGDAILRIREQEILFSPQSLLAKFGPLLTEICARNKVYSDRTLQAMATLSLGKFMCVSSEFCERHLRLLLTILEKSKDATIRSNIVIAMGDMSVCFSTLIDDNISFLYNRLGDEDSLVKKNTVMVLTHLILNGMVKVKGQISEMAKCLEDDDSRIADLAKLFFTELATKDNAIYNNLPDIISNLTNSPADQLSEDGFHRIMKFIFSFDFAEKGKQAENVVEKLCQRFKMRSDERGWRDIAYCLSLLPMKSEKSFRKLLDNFPLYQDKLHEDFVHKAFMEIIGKGRATQKLQKGDLKAAVDELENKIEQVMSGDKTVTPDEEVAEEHDMDEPMTDEPSSANSKVNEQ
ncbi:hypothetical protein DM01DRAFT_1300277 [Hesseltinella vesiculosa]|uniref:Condensin complex subunit 1 n=1 Tax=Hesseltinella vesiculosa TaxID=101127 RepID=A0A1X2GSN8_9FUNG|nr:hypothetical protein DM01DRAFT_1300277 [Hesseltinella vesiculosa]